VGKHSTFSLQWCASNWKWCSIYRACVWSAQMSKQNSGHGNCSRSGNLTSKCFISLLNTWGSERSMQNDSLFYLVNSKSVNKEEEEEEEEEAVVIIAVWESKQVIQETKLLILVQKFWWTDHTVQKKSHRWNKINSYLCKISHSYHKMGMVCKIFHQKQQNGYTVIIFRLNMSVLRKTSSSIILFTTNSTWNLLSIKQEIWHSSNQLL